MDDLQLLELLEKAKERQKGDRGPSGIGIREINQSSSLSFTVVLDDGTTKEIAIPAPIKGDAGERGVAGAKGDVGSSGRDGRAGPAGADGINGLPGRDGSYVDTAVVNPNGDLLLSLSTDGEILNVGRVVGPAGAAGTQGPAGLPGASGKDGAAVLSGPRSPQSDDGKDGDHWIDLSSTTYIFLKRLLALGQSLRNFGRNS